MVERDAQTVETHDNCESFPSFSDWLSLQISFTSIQCSSAVSQMIDMNVFLLSIKLEVRLSTGTVSSSCKPLLDLICSDISLGWRAGNQSDFHNH